jgi:murein L,D-transpeptidase YcbB/YkuD
LSGDAAAAIDRLQTEMTGGQTVRIPLARPLPVYVLYWTAIGHDDGAVDFRSDVYGRDARLLAALTGRRTIGRVARAETECQLATG